MYNDLRECVHISDMGRDSVSSQQSCCCARMPRRASACHVRVHSVCRRTAAYNDVCDTITRWIEACTMNACSYDFDSDGSTHSDCTALTALRCTAQCSDPHCVHTRIHTHTHISAAHHTMAAADVAYDVTQVPAACSSSDGSCAGAACVTTGAGCTAASNPPYRGVRTRRARTPLPAPSRAVPSSRLSRTQGASSSSISSSVSVQSGQASSSSVWLAALPSPLVVVHPEPKSGFNKSVIERKHRGTSRNVLGGFYTS